MAEGISVAGATTQASAAAVAGAGADGTESSAVADLRDCVAQDTGVSSRPVWNPDIPNAPRFLDQWQPVPLDGEPGNAFRLQWEAFTRHVLEDDPFPHDLHSGTRGVRVAELGMRSSAEGRRVEVPPARTSAARARARAAGASAQAGA